VVSIYIPNLGFDYVIGLLGGIVLLEVIGVGNNESKTLANSNNTKPPTPTLIFYKWFLADKISSILSRVHFL
jgi:hypothetical protein